MASQFMTNGVSSFFKMSSSYVQQNMQAMQQLTSQSVMSDAEELASNEDEQSKNMMQQMVNLASASNPIPITIYVSQVHPHQIKNQRKKVR